MSNKNIILNSKYIGRNDLIGAKFGKLLILEIDHYVSKHIYYKCKCDCGNICIKEKYALMHNINLQCTDCYYKEIEDNTIKNMIGKKFGKLTILSFDHIEEYINPNTGKRHLFKYYKCKCDCGNECIASGFSMRDGTKASCGCLVGKAGITHGMTKTKFYKTYDSMKSRCYYINNPSYPEYGGREIKVCDRWIGPDGFFNFKDDMYDEFLEHCRMHGEHNTSIDRIDVDGDYCKENCRWATITVQNNNMTSNFFIYYRGNRYTIAELWKTYCKINIIDYFRFYNKLYYLGIKRNDTVTEEQAAILFNPYSYVNLARRLETAPPINAVRFNAVSFDKN